MLKAPGSFRGNAIRGCSRESAGSAQRTRSCGYRYVLFDCCDVPYRIIDIAVGGVVTVGYGTDEMDACVCSAATRRAGIGFGQRDRTDEFDNTLRDEHKKKEEAVFESRPSV